MTRFLLQAVTENSHGALLENILSASDTHRFIISSAFVTRGGVESLGANLLGLGDKLTVYAGIRNGITTAEGLGALIEIGAKLYLVDTGAVSPIFHPKVYLRISKTEADLVVGSANLTTGGLYSNVEASLVHKLDLADAADAGLAMAVLESFESMREKYPRNVISVSDQAELDPLIDAGRVVTEDAVSAGLAMNFYKSPPKTKGKLGIPVMKLLTKRPKKVATKSAKKASGVPASPKTSTGKSIPPEEDESLTLLWSSGPLKRRDLSIPKNPNSSLTGSMLLKKGESDIDQQTYFREDVFQDLDWEPDNRTPGKELATTQFQIIVAGVDHGVYDLVVTHDTRTDTATYKQRQPMSAIRWGEARPLIAKEELLDRTMRLYRDPDAPNPLVLTVN